MSPPVIQLNFMLSWITGGDIVDVGNAQKAIQSLIEQQAEKDVRIKELEVALEKSEEKVTRLEATVDRCESVGGFFGRFLNL